VLAFLFLPVLVGVSVLVTSFDDGWRSVFTLVPFLLVGFALPYLYTRRVVVSATATTNVFDEDIVFSPDYGTLPAVPPSPEPLPPPAAAAAPLHTSTPLRMKHLTSSDIVILQQQQQQPPPPPLPEEDTSSRIFDDPARLTRLGSIFTPAEELQLQVQEDPDKDNSEDDDGVVETPDTEDEEAPLGGGGTEERRSYLGDDD
jgi:hypothetical protein